MLRAPLHVEQAREALAATDDTQDRRKTQRQEKLELLSALPTRPSASGRHVRLRYQLSPLQAVGRDRVEGVEFKAAGSSGPTVIQAGLLLTSIGYRALPVPDLPFDPALAVVPNEGGRVVDPLTLEGEHHPFEDPVGRHPLTAPARPRTK